MFEESNLLSLTNLPDTIWFTSFGGTGEKPGATTNDCCKLVHFAKRKARGPTRLEGEGATEGAGGNKVETKDGTNFGLPCIWLAAPAIKAAIGGKPMPETARADAWDCRLYENVTGMPPAMLECSS